jgi:hypothetical protein
MNINSKLPTAFPVSTRNMEKPPNTVRIIFPGRSLLVRLLKKVPIQKPSTQRRYIKCEFMLFISILLHWLPQGNVYSIHLPTYLALCLLSVRVSMCLSTYISIHPRTKKPTHLLFVTETYNKSQHVRKNIPPFLSPNILVENLHPTWDRIFKTVVGIELSYSSWSSQYGTTQQRRPEFQQQTPWPSLRATAACRRSWWQLLR